MDKLKSKSAGFVWEFMFTRSMYQTADRIKQHEMLNKIAQLVDSGKITSTLNKTYSRLKSGKRSLSGVMIFSPW